MKVTLEGDAEEILEFMRKTVGEKIDESFKVVEREDRPLLERVEQAEEPGNDQPDEHTDDIIVGTAPEFSWTPEIIAEVERLHHEGFTYKNISIALSRFTGFSISREMLIEARDQRVFPNITSTRPPQVKTYLKFPKNADPNSHKERLFRYIIKNPGSSQQDLSRHIGTNANARLRELRLADRIYSREGPDGRLLYFVNPDAIAPPTESGQPAIVIPPQPVKPQDEEPKPEKPFGLKRAIMATLLDRGPMAADRLRQTLERTNSVSISSNNLYARLAELTRANQVTRIAGTNGRYIYRALPQASDVEL